MSRILVAGIGNIFEGDDGFGCAVAQRLLGADLAAGVDVVDFGIRGIDLGYALMDGYDTVILVDAIDRGAAPGTVLVIEPELPEPSGDICGPLMAAHELNPAQVLRVVASLGDKRPRLLLVGCQPETLGGEQGHLGLSAPVTAAVEVAARRIIALVDELNDGAVSARQPPVNHAAHTTHSAIPAPGATT